MEPLDQFSAIRTMLEKNPGAKILIVGSRSTNFSERFRREERLVFWDSTDPATKRKDRIPEGVRAVIFTRFLKHSFYKRILDMIPKGVVTLKYVQGTGQIRDFLETLDLGKQPAKEEAVVAESHHVPSGAVQATAIQQKRVKSGALAAFIKARADFDTKATHQEIDRLFNEATATSLETTRFSVYNSFYQLRKKRGLSQPVPPLAPEQAVIAAPVAQTAIEKPAADQSRPNKIEQAIGVLRNCLEQLQLAPLALEEILADYDRLRKLEERLHRLEQAVKPILESPNGAAKKES